MSDNLQHNRVSEDESVACNKVKKSRRMLWIALAVLLSGGGAVVGYEAYRDAQNRGRYEKIDLKNSIDNVVDDYFPEPSKSGTNNEIKPLNTSPSNKDEKAKKKPEKPVNDSKVKENSDSEEEGSDTEDPEIIYT